VVQADFIKLILQGSSRAFNAETPKAFKSKRRLQEPLSETFVKKTINNTPGVDSDVDVFPSAFKKAKKVQTNSKPNMTSNPKVFGHSDKCIYYPIYIQIN